MDSEVDIVRNRLITNLTFMPWYRHIKDALLGQWKRFILYCVASFGVFWGLIEAASFFYPNFDLDKLIILFVILVICFSGSLLRCVYDYRHVIPDGLEGESLKAQAIALERQPFWEYALAYELVKNRIEKIDQKLDDILNNRVHVKVTRSMDVDNYMQWIGMRPENLLRIVEASKQLLIFDLVQAIHPEDEKGIDYLQLIRIVDLIESLYKNVYEFETEGRELKIPEGFELVHEIQFEWVSVIRDGFYQMLSILESVAGRAKGDFSPVNGKIVFNEAPRIEEFCEELDRLEGLFL